MKLNQRMVAWAGMILVWGVVVVSLGTMVRVADRPDRAATAGLVQQEIGYRIQALSSHDLDLRARLRGDQDARMREMEGLQTAGPGRLQEDLGRAIAWTTQWVLREQARLDDARVRASEELRQHRREDSARRQEQLGMAVQAAARAAPEGGDAFRMIFQKKAAYFDRIQRRTGRRLESRLQEVSLQKSEFPGLIPLFYEEAIQSARRSFRMLHRVRMADMDRGVERLEGELKWRRLPEDYVALAGAVSEIYSGPRRASGFEEYGLQALIGIVLVMMWTAFITRPAPALSNAPRADRTGGPEGLRKGGATTSQSVSLFSWPREVFFGRNISQRVGRYAAKDDCKRAMIITDRGIHREGLLESVKTSFSGAGVDFSVYDQVMPEVPDDRIVDLLERCRQEGVDLLVAVGGGSVIDTAKATGILMTNGGKIQDFEGVDRVFCEIPRFFVVPTTAGCGSEASQFCVVLDTRMRRKMEIFSRRIIPGRIFIDPVLTVTMSPELTASSGIDALSNCIESYFSTWASPLTDALALHSIRLISGSLREAVADGLNLQARQDMAMAAFEAGLAFTNAHAGAVHALGHPIAGLLNVPQRLGNAILLPHVMRYNMTSNVDRMVDVGVAMGEGFAGIGRPEAAERVVSAVQCLMQDIGLPTTLDQVGVKRENISDLSRQALQDAFLRTNPCMLDRRDIESIYERAFGEYPRTVHSASTRHRPVAI